MFGSLLTFEISLADRVESKCKGVSFQSIHEDESLEKGKALYGQVNESIAMLTNQFSNVIKKISSSNNYGSNNRFQNNFRRREFDRPNARESDRSNIRESDRPNTRDSRTFKCRECEGHGHYQVECPIYWRKQKNSFGATLSDEIAEEEEFLNSLSVLPQMVKKNRTISLMGI